MKALDFTSKIAKKRKKKDYEIDTPEEGSDPFKPVNWKKTNSEWGQKFKNIAKDRARKKFQGWGRSVPNDDDNDSRKSSERWAPRKTTVVNIWELFKKKNSLESDVTQQTLRWKSTKSDE